jgi:hypothetical protein
MAESESESETESESVFDDDVTLLASWMETSVAIESIRCVCLCMVCMAMRCHRYAETNMCMCTGWMVCPSCRL